MTLEKMRIKCKLGDDIRVVTVKKDVIQDELLRVLEQEYNRPVIVSHYEDYEHDVVTISSNGLQSVLTEHAEHHSDSPLATLKLFLLPTSRISSSSDDINPFTNSTGITIPNNFANKSGSNSNSNISVNSNSSTGSGIYSSSPRNGMMLNGINHPTNIGRRTSSNYGINPWGNEGHLHLGEVNNYLVTANGDGESNNVNNLNNNNAAPPFRTPPRTPPDSPRNPLRTPPGSPKGGRNENKDNGGFFNFTHNLRVDTDINNNVNNNINNLNNNINNIKRDSQSPRRPPPHYHLHDTDNSENINVLNMNINHNSGGSRNDTPPFRTPPQSPRSNNNSNSGNNTTDSAPLTPSSLSPPAPFSIPEPRVSPPVPARHTHLELHNNNSHNNHNNINHINHNNHNGVRPLLDTRVPVPIPVNIPFQLEPHRFPAPHSPQAIPVPVPFPFPVPKSPRIASPKLPPSIMEQTKEEEEQGPINWEKGSVLGRGGFGTVYMGMRDNGELIAVKQLELDDNEDPKSRAMLSSFAQEIDVMRTLRHENIVRYLGIKFEERFLNIFLEYVAGGSISTLLSKFNKFPEPVIRVYTKQILQGIAYLHEHRIVHRDIKGANILVDVNGTVKLADFGCSKIFAGLKSQMKTVLGTPYWMAPEVIKQSGYGRSADIWSLGCVIIEMATGQPPWQAQFSEVTAAMFHIASTESLPDMPANLSPEALDFLSLCFKRVPKERPNAKTLMKHPFLQDATQGVKDLPRRNSFHVPAASPTLGAPAPSPRNHHNRLPSVSVPPLPTINLTSLSLYSSDPATPHKYHKLDMLPTPLVLSIFRFLAPELHIKMRQVCKLFSKVIKEDLMAPNKSQPLVRTRSDSKNVWNDDKISWTNLKKLKKAIHCLALSETFLASGGEDKKISVWDVKKARRLFSLKGHTSTVTGVCIDRGNNFYSASADTTAKIWTPYKNNSLNKKSCQATMSGHLAPLTSIVLADHDSKIVTASYDKTLRVWDSKGTYISSLNAHEGSVNCVQCDGVVIVSASSDSTLKIWDIRVPHSVVRTLTGHVGEVKCCYFGNDKLISGGEDKIVRIWDLGTGKNIRKLDHTFPITGVTCDGTKIASSGDKCLKLWEWESDTCVKTITLPSPVFCLKSDNLKLYAAGQDKIIRILSPEPVTTTPKTFLSRLTTWNQ